MPVFLIIYIESYDNYTHHLPSMTGCPTVGDTQQ